MQAGFAGLYKQILSIKHALQGPVVPVDHLFRLPSKIILRILAELDVVGVVRCMQVCRTLNSLAHSTQLYEYKAKLTLANLEDGPVDDTYDIQSRLRQLEAHQEAWKDFRWSSTHAIDTLGPGGLWDMTGGVFGLGKKGDANTGFSFTRLPSRCRAITKKEWTIEGLGFPCDGFAFEPSEDLLVLIRARMDDGGLTMDFEVKLYSLENGAPHPRATQKTLSVQHFGKGRHVEYWAYSIQIYGDQISILCEAKEDEFTQLAVLNWVTGNFKFGRYVEDPFGISSTFLSSKFLVHTVYDFVGNLLVPKLAIVDLEHASHQDRTWKVHLRLPVPNGFDGTSIVLIHTGFPSAERAVRKPHARASFMTSNRLVSIPLFFRKTENRETYDWLLLVVLARSLIRLAEATMARNSWGLPEVPWETWGPPNTKLLPLDVGMPSSPLYVHGLRVIMRNDPGSTGKSFRVYDFNQHGIRPDEKSKNEFSLETEFESTILGCTIRTRLPCRIVVGELPEAHEWVMLAEDSIVAVSKKESFGSQCERPGNYSVTNPFDTQESRHDRTKPSSNLPLYKGNDISKNQHPSNPSALQETSQRKTTSPAMPNLGASGLKYQRIRKDDAMLLIIDHQIGLFELVRDYEPAEFRNNVLAHAALGKVFNLPTIMTTSTDDGPNGPMLQEVLDMHSNAPLIRRKGEVNAWDSPEFRAAVKAMYVCTAFLALSLIEEGYEVFANSEASGTYSRRIADEANDRMRAAGVNVMSMYAVAIDLMRDWRHTPGYPELTPYFDQSVYGMVERNYKATSKSS
ncbi:hypothetical protein VNI00_005381 [Paramarasmius palmivorus]|uniref:F-box domain-containing protein n=1 Tax=Paramarasmius palmivorus TaxID=297713 RepID=A0AAW0DFA7_9AGAR